ncbi:MAG: hypothetical protein OXI67_21245 [Candidatus Poribacteria bacterium]|nr:hypothetical protein [Candidatus Poribacteria bacterium]
MIRDILTNKWCIGGFGFLIIFAVLCYFWYQHDIASFQQQLSATDDIILQGDMSQKAQKNVQTDVPLTESFKSVENMSESVEDMSVSTEETIQKTDTLEKNIDLTADVPTSPFGFGPYPEVPADYPFQERLWDNATPEHELLVRVRVKLWKQGTQTIGAMFDDNNGLIYPSIPGVIYVQWQNTKNDDPEFAGRRYVSLIMGDGDTAKQWESSYLIDGKYEPIGVDNDNEASGIKVYEYPNGGINPHKFLDLPR